jgi:Trk K+ transport system NAD-binding subunit
VSRLAASAFAAAMVERQVIGTMSIGRSALMIADVPVVSGSPLVGQSVDAVHEQGEARVIALQHRGSTRLDWTPPATYVLAPQDRLTVVATRAGLGRLLAGSMTVVPQPDAS